MTSSHDPALVAVMRLRGWLSRILWTRLVLQSLGAGLAAWLLLAAFFAQRPIDSSWMGARASGALLVAIVCAVALIGQRGSISVLRAALWIEEHASCGYALVTWVEQSQGAAPPSLALQRTVAQSSPRAFAVALARLPLFARSQLSGPLLFGLAAVVILRMAEREPVVTGAATAGSANLQIGNGARRAAPIGAWQVRLTPPSYTGLPARVLGDVTIVRVVSGTRIEVQGGDAPPDSVRVRPVSDSLPRATAMPVEVLTSGWRSEVVATDRPSEIRVSRDQYGKLLLVEGVADSLPRVVLAAPARDSVLRRAEGVLPLRATVHDDFGLTRASFEVVISSGDGERFVARSVQLGARALGGVRDATFGAALDLRALQLGPGDVVHLRAVARDAHPLAAREAGTSETRSFRIARASEYDSIAVEPAPPPEVDTSLLSQRMLLMLTERLEQRRPRLAATVMREESSRLARDQARLRQAVGDAVFQRLSGDGGGEHSHFAGDGHDHGVESVGGKLAMSAVNAQGMLEEGDDAPVLAINRPLLEAYNAMWDAGRALEQTELRAAIPFMRLALAAIERARAASRLYLRGRPPTVIIDVAKVRLAGKDPGTPDARVPRASIPWRSAMRESRLLAVAQLAASDPLAARDSIALLRLEALVDDPAFAQALSSLLDAFGRAARADLTVPFLNARRVLGGITRIPPTAWSRGGPP